MPVKLWISKRDHLIRRYSIKIVPSQLKLPDLSGNEELAKLYKDKSELKETLEKAMAQAVKREVTFVSTFRNIRINEKVDAGRFAHAE